MGELKFFRDKLHGISGIWIGENKKELLQSRLHHRMEALRLQSLEDYRRYLSTLPHEHDEWQLMVNELTTNKTEFFREQEQFAHLVREFLPEWEKRHGPKRKLRVWCAASATGEEAYTLAMVLQDHFKDSNRFEIVA